MIPHSRPSIGKAEAEAAAAVVQSGMIAQGSEVAALEEACAARLGFRHAVATNTGTAALHLSLLALGLPPGSRVAIPAYACAALPAAVAMAGHSPTFLDAADDGNPITDGPKPQASATIVAHLFGKPASLPKGGAVIEDIAQAVGSPAGRRGVAAVISLYATKMITCGEGGMVLTDDGGYAGAVRDLRDYDKRGDGRSRFNYKMTDIQAAIGRVQLGRLDDFIARRQAMAQAYTDAWKNLPLLLPSGEGHVYYRYTVRLKQTGSTPPGAPVTTSKPLAWSHATHAFADYLARHGIDAKMPVYPPAPTVPAHCPGAARAYGESVSIPLYPALNDEQVERIIRTVATYFDQ